MHKKIFLCLFLILLILSSACLGADLSELSNEDLYSSQNNFTINNSILGNAFVTSKSFTLDSSSNGGTISGDLFVMSNTININSSKNEDSSISKSSTIYGNVFAMADSFTLGEGSIVNGDLYFLGKTLNLEKGSQIGGNIFICADTVTINSQINGSTYINTKYFNMDYDAYIYNDLNLNGENVKLNGQVRRNCDISCKDFTSLYGFKVAGNLKVDANKITFSGEAVGNTTFNSKEINLDTSASTCLIRGNLNYSANSEINIDKSNVLGEVNFSKYKSTNTNFGKVLLNKILGLITFATYVLGISFLINKFIPKLSNKEFDMSFKNFLRSFGIGLLILILLPAIAIILLLLRVTTLLAMFVFILYALLLIISLPVFINTLANKYKKKNVYLNILILTTIFWIISLIPYLGFINLLILTLGLGMIFIKRPIK